MNTLFAFYKENNEQALSIILGSWCLVETHLNLKYVGIFWIFSNLGTWHYTYLYFL